MEADHTHEKQSDLAESNEIGSHDHEPQFHSHKIPDIRSKLCESMSETCRIKSTISIENEIIDTSLQLAKSQEIGILLSSSNFNEVMQDLSTSKVSTEFINLQNQLNQQILYDYLDINTQGIFCSVRVCGASFKYKNSDEWESFQKDFFSKNEHLGNLFIAHFDNETRVLFFPDDESKGIIR